LLRLGYGVAIQRKSKTAAIPKTPVVAITSPKKFFIVLLLLGAPWRVKVGWKGLAPLLGVFGY
jgi:hypothetical protein